MELQNQQERPPYIRFERRTKENRTRTIETGSFATDDVDFVLVTPVGSKDEIEREAVEYLDYLDRQVVEGRFNGQWAAQFRDNYARWKTGQELPPNGTPIRTWASIGAAQIRRLIEIGILTVEDLAAANEQALAGIGMGGRALKTLAISYLESAKGTDGKVAQKIVALTEENTALKVRNEELEKRCITAETELAKYKDARGADKPPALAATK